MQDRYSHAAEQTAPAVYRKRDAIITEGYWIDDDRYFVSLEEMDPALGIVRIPSLVDRRTGEIRKLVSVDTVVALINGHLAEMIDPATAGRAHFDWAGEDLVGVTIGEWNYVIDVEQRRLASVEPAMELPSLFSPDGRYACYIRENDLWLCDRKTRARRALTTDGSPNRYYGQNPEASWARIPAGRGAPSGRWSPDSQWFLTHLVDDRDIPDLPVVEHAPQDGGRPRLHRYKYCMKDDPKPKLAFVAIHADSGRIVALDIDPTEIGFYSPFLDLIRTIWFETSRIAWFIRFDRYQKRAELIRFDLEQGSAEVVFSEEADTGYLQMNTSFTDKPIVWTLSGSSEFIWYSERDGWGHLYLHDAVTGAMKWQITRGNWVVRRILHVDEQARRIVFAAHGVDPAADPAHRTLCAVNFDGTGFELLLAHDGDLYINPHEIDGPPQDSPFRDAAAQGGLSPDGQAAVVQYWSVDRGNRTELVDLAVRPLRPGPVIATALPAAGENLPRRFTALAADGVTLLHGLMFVPPDFDERQSYPLIDHIYGCTAVSKAPQSYMTVKSSHCRALAALGFLCVMLDSRGIAYRDRAFNQAGYGGFFEPQLADHAAVIRQLCDRHPFIDRARVGIFGESYGGMMTARALFDYPDMFKVGVSVCGLHDLNQSLAFQPDWSMGPQAHESQSNITAAHKLQGRLFLLHGDADARVPVAHSLALAAALIRSHRDFDMLIVPNEGHAVLSTSAYAQRRMWDYFVRHLLGETPPEHFEICFAPEGLERSVRHGLLEIM
nr:alpha/beta fold hydrolase [Sphingomonas sp. Y57]